jgi:hypothetical protein
MWKTHEGRGGKAPLMLSQVGTTTFQFYLLWVIISYKRQLFTRLLRRVVWQKLIDVSEMLAASIIWRKSFWNVGKLIPDYTAQQSAKRPPLHWTWWQHKTSRSSKSCYTGTNLPTSVGSTGEKTRRQKRKHVFIDQWGHTYAHTFSTTVNKLAPVYNKWTWSMRYETYQEKYMCTQTPKPYISPLGSENNKCILSTIYIWKSIQIISKLCAI